MSSLPINPKEWDLDDVIAPVSLQPQNPLQPYSFRAPGDATATSFSMLSPMERSNSASTATTLSGNNYHPHHNNNQQQHEKSHSAGSIQLNFKSGSSASSINYAPSITPFYKVYDTPATTKEFEKMETINPHDSWSTLVIKVLPLFNGEGLKLAIEDLNELVRRCINDRSPQLLFEDINELLDSGMFTLNGKLKGVPDEKLVSRLVELWSFYFGTIIPYFEGVFLPLQMQMGSHKISIRRLVLMSFRDHVILPIRDRVEDAFNKLFHDFDSGIPVTDTAARMLQMIYILSSIFSDDDKQKDIDRILSKLKNNWNLFMRRRDRRGFVGMSPAPVKNLFRD